MMKTKFNLENFITGKCIDAYTYFGSHVEGGKTTFRVYAPNAKEVYLVSNLNSFQIEEKYRLNKDDNDVFSLTINDDLTGCEYKYVLITKEGWTLWKSDPFARESVLRPSTNSVVYKDSYNFNDSQYLKKRKSSNYNYEPLNIYEMNIGSWRKTYSNTFRTYSDIAIELKNYLKEMGYNAVELMPLQEFPLDESWGYQSCGYFSITSRYGSPDEFRYLVDTLHSENIKVIMDFVPGHICKDEHGLYRFDGTFMFEFDDPYRRENSSWGTANIDFSKGPASSYFKSALFFYINSLHVDGVRIDAASNLYYHLGDPNNGENQPGQQFLKDISLLVDEYDKSVIISLEDSSMFNGVTRNVLEGGLGASFKWNMGWMNDTLRFMKEEDGAKKWNDFYFYHPSEYAFSEKYILPLSHDEVVYCKKALVDKMPGNYEDKFALYRVLLGYMYAFPGKKLMFMGGEFGQISEWRDYQELDWFLIDKYPMHKSTLEFSKTINNIYLNNEELFKGDLDYQSFRWIYIKKVDLIYIFERIYQDKSFICAINMSDYDNTIKLSLNSEYKNILNSDWYCFGGSGKGCYEIINDEIYIPRKSVLYYINRK